MSRRMIYKGRNDNLDMLDDYVNEGRDPTYQDYRRISRSRSPYMKSPMSRFGPLNDDYYRNGRSRSPENRDSFPKLERVLKIPHEFVGYIIGNNGKVKQNIELLSGASLDCSNRNIDKKKFRSIFIYGTKDQVDLAECEVKKYLPIGEFSYFIDGLEFITDLNEKVHAISDKQAGLLKGYKGQTISDIQFNSGAVVGISKLVNKDGKYDLTIRGSFSQINKASSLIDGIIDLNLNEVLIFYFYVLIFRKILKLGGVSFIQIVKKVLLVNICIHLILTGYRFLLMIIKNLLKIVPFFPAANSEINVVYSILKFHVNFHIVLLKIVTTRIKLLPIQKNVKVTP